MNCGECDIDFACAKEGVPCIRLAPSAAPAPGDMVMVPREPTIAMCLAGDGARHNVDDATRSPAVYRAMIAAAPAPVVPNWMHKLDEILSNATVSRTDSEMVDAARLALKEGWALSAAPIVSIDMVLHCPKCGLQHIDAADPWVAKYSEEVCKARGFDLWTNPPHKSHLCRREDGGCGHIWRPADVPTNGVAALRTKGKSDMPPALTVSEKATVDCVTTIEVLRAHIARLESAAPVVPLTAQPVAWAKQEKKKLRITHMDMRGEDGWQPLVFGTAAIGATHE